MSQTTVDVVLRLLDANARKDWAAVYALYAPDIVWEDNEGLWGDWGVPRGHDELRAAWRRWFEGFGEVSWHLQGDLVDDGDDVVATYDVRGRGRESGVPVNQRITLLWTVRDGKVVRVRAYGERADALAVLGPAD